MLFPFLSEAAQTSVFHLRNGDRITGVPVWEDAQEVVVSNSWNPGYLIPKLQIESREILPVANPLAPVKKLITDALVSTNVVALSTPEWLRQWSGEVALGLDYERGATDHQTYYLRGKLAYAHPYKSNTNEYFRNVLLIDDNYGKTAGTVSDDRLLGSCKTDADLSERFYLYNFGSAGYDKVRLIDLHFEDGPGLGYHWFKTKSFFLNLELGASYLSEVHSDHTKTEDFFYRFGENFAWKINNHVTWTEKLEYLPQEGYLNQFRLRAESTLTCALFLNLALNLTVADLYDTKPAAAVPNNDFQLRTSLSFKF